MRLIDADNILDFIDDAIKTAHGIGLRPAAALYLKKRIEDEPTIDPVKHGRWEEYCGDLNCDKCGAIVEHFGIKKGKWNYCPNCGSLMDGGEE